MKQIISSVTQMETDFSITPDVPEDNFLNNNQMILPR